MIPVRQQSYKVKDCQPVIIQNTKEELIHLDITNSPKFVKKRNTIGSHSFPHDGSYELL